MFTDHPGSLGHQAVRQRITGGTRDADAHREGGDAMPVPTDAALVTLAEHHDMVLETRKRDGSWIATPVNPLVEGDHVYFRTWHRSGKAKRLRNHPEVRFAPSTARGRPTGPWLQGHASLLDGDESAQAAALINH